MITVSDFVQALKDLFPGVKFYNGTLNRNESQCIGVYARDSAPVYRALGGSANTSYSVLPVTILIHWTENADACERQANAIYNTLFETEGLIVGGRRVILLSLRDSAPVDVGRDDSNICERTLRINITYEREAI
jgi:hypothetical protein